MCELDVLLPFQQKFYDPEEFSYLHELRSSWKTVQREFQALEEHALHPWPEEHLFEKRDSETQTTERGKGWNVFGLYAFGKRSQKGCEACPETAELLQSFPKLPHTAAFSVLVPGSHILPHSGYIGYSHRVLRCHLGLEVPQTRDIEATRTEWFQQSVSPFDFHSPTSYDGCALRCGSEKTLWKEGEMMLFDDSFTHEAWNFTNERRVILLLDVERPERFNLPADILGPIMAKSQVNPLADGSRGDEYLDKLTSKYGY